MRQSRTLVRKDKKIKRNELCPCGSGKKFKRCCWIKIADEKHRRNILSEAIKTNSNDEKALKHSFESNLLKRKQQKENENETVSV